ncbi:ABC transporter substrate-binding protein [Sphaerisporangium rhizosphaerae]|uniref:ABC transporter substrate-binding protein n=1 Tax=Sphaerisporangium rhizosphaerae TaxID=2269375 RepID=A0ABW2PGW0_9ACTN
MSTATTSARPGGARRRLAGWLAAVAALALPLAACGSGGGQESGDGKVTLTVAGWSLAKNTEFGALFDAFQKANPGITVKPLDIPADDYSEKVTTMLAGGDRTDVLAMKTLTDYARHASRGQLLEVTDLAKAPDGAKLAGLPAYDLQGKYYALPFRHDFWLLYYNKKYFKEAGLPQPEALTWDQYASLARRLTKGDGAKKVYGAYHHTWRSVVQAIAAAQTGGDQLGGDYGFFADQYKMALALQKEGVVLDFGTATSQHSDYRTMFETGAAAMMPMGTWYAAGVIQAKKKGATDVDWGLAPLPQRPGATGVTTFGAPTAFAVNSRSEHADAARKFVAFAASRAGAQAIVKVGVVPALQAPEITDAYFSLDGMPSDALSKKAFAPDKVVLEMPVSDKSSDVDTILNEEHQLIMVGEKSVDDGLRAMNDRVKTEVLN